MEFPGYVEHIWWLKWYATLVVTEEGIFIKDKVPDDYGGPKLEVESVQRVIFATRQGYLWKHEYHDLSMVQDKEKKKGVGYHLDAVSTLFAAVNSAPTGPSATIVNLEMRENPYLAERRDRLLALIQATIALPQL